MSKGQRLVVPAESVRKVFEVSRLALAEDFELDFLAAELAGAIGAALRLASRKRSARMEEIVRVSNALEEFRASLRALEGTVNPPPPLPVTGRGGRFTPWDAWLVLERFDDLDEQSGRPTLHDWRSIAKYLAVFQVAFRKQPRGGGRRNQDGIGNPTIRFLDEAMQVGRNVAAARGVKLNGFYALPVSTLNYWLKHGGHELIADRVAALEAKGARFEGA